MAEVIVILFTSVDIAVSVPWRKIHSELDTAFFTSISNLFDHVTFSASEGAVFYAMFSVSRRPKAKTVVVLAGQDQPLDPREFQSIYPLIGIKCRWIEDLFRFSSVAPFFI